MTSRAALWTVVLGDHVGWCGRRFGPTPEKIQAASRVQAPSPRPQAITEPPPVEAEELMRHAVLDPVRHQTRYLIDQFNTVPALPTGPDFNSSNPRNSRQ